jgi:hypothetical protein
MNPDNDNVRVDLLKFRRKAYLTYPENSPERKKFLKTILENELRLTEQEVPQNLVNFLLEEDNFVLHNAIKNISLCVFSFIFSTAAAWMFHSLFHGFVSSLFVGASIGSVWAGYQYGRDYWQYKKSINVVKQYSNDMKKYMNKITNDIKRLEGPHGF